MTWKSEADRVVFDLGTHWVSREGVGHYKVWKSSLTHSVLRSTYHFSTDDGLAANRAVDRCLLLHQHALKPA